MLWLLKIEGKMIEDSLFIVLSQAVFVFLAFPSFVCVYSKMVRLSALSLSL